MPCPNGLGWDVCADKDWPHKLKGHWEPAGYRADCLRCSADRAIEWSVPPQDARAIPWNVFCGCGKDAVRPLMRARLGPCMPGGRTGRQEIDPDAVVRLALAKIPPVSLKLALLELTGITTSEALEMLGVRRENRSRVIKDRASISMQNRRSGDTMQGLTKHGTFVPPPAGIKAAGTVAEGGPALSPAAGAGSTLRYSPISLIIDVATDLSAKLGHVDLITERTTSAVRELICEHRTRTTTRSRRAI